MENPEEIIENLIQKESKILSLKPGLDDENAESISKTTFEKACNILNRFGVILIYLFRNFTEDKQFTPTIGPCANGSIDLHWKNKHVNLLINVSENGICDIYFEKANGDNIGGKIK